MNTYGPRQWEDFKATFPNQTRSPAAIIIWSILILADLLLAGWVMMQLDISLPRGMNQMEQLLEIVVMVLVAGLAFFVEDRIYTTFRRLFR